MTEKACSRCHQIKPIEDFVIDRRKRTGRGSSCKPCERSRTARRDPVRERLRKRRYKSENREKVREQSAAYFQRNKQRIMAKNGTRQKANRDKSRAYSKAYYSRNRRKELARAKQFFENNPGYRRLFNSRLRAAVVQATPSWADMASILSVHRQCELLAKETGRCWEVDHIVPLKGKSVCGLNVACNLRVVTKRCNRTKGNKHLFISGTYFNVSHLLGNLALAFNRVSY